MKHKNKVFSFVNKNDEKVEFESMDYSFGIQELLIDRFGEETLKTYYSTGILNHTLRLSEAKEDLPKLLKGDVSVIDLEKEYDEVVEVYDFFLKYEKNAWLRRAESEKEMIASAIREIQKLVTSIPEDIYPKKT